MGKIKHLIGRIAPKQIIKKYHQCVNNSNLLHEWRAQWRVYENEVNRLKKTEKPINVLFLVVYSSVWKYDSVYRLMATDHRFCPMIMVCPIADYGQDHMLENYNPTYEMFKKKDYNVIKAYDEVTDRYIDVDEINPDIIFYAFQWQSHVDERYNIYTLQKYLKCYVNYSYKNNPFEWSIASRAQQMMWMYFSECEENKQLAISFHPREFKKNIHVVGYPMYDEFVNLKETGYHWKYFDNVHKRIVWAPHHTIPGDDSMIKLSTFLLFADFMLEIANKYKDSIEIAFRPHPQLKASLYQHKEWGKEKTDCYYKQWETGENTTYVVGEYSDLLKSSSAMIHDCHSFTVEYLYLNKPVMFLTNYDREGQCNAVGKKALSCHYQGTTKQEIEDFIVNVVLNGYDSMRDKRTSFYNNILVPPNNQSVAENIINEITKALEI